MAPALRDGLYSFLYYQGATYTGRYKGGLRDGIWTVRNGDGSKVWEVTWSAGEWHGPATTWWKNGVARHVGQHEHGARSGEWSYRFENGQLAACGSHSQLYCLGGD